MYVCVCVRARVTCVVLSLFSSVIILPSNGFLYGENDMACVMTIWSSNICTVSSPLFMMNVPVSLYAEISSITGSHSDSILSKAFQQREKNKKQYP